MICGTYGFIQQLLDVSRACEYAPLHKVWGGSHERSSEIFGPIMRGKGPVSMAELAQLSGKTYGAVNNAMRDTLSTRGLVKKLWIDGQVFWEWTGG